jgi:uncharacterized protein involved in exopolysaccharide biosynthesis
MQALRTSIVTINNTHVVDDLVVLWQSLAERAKGRDDLLKNATEKEQQIVALERELKEVREAAADEKKRLEDELAEEKCKVVEATAQLTPCLLVGRIFVLMIPLKRRSLTLC